MSGRISDYVECPSCHGRGYLPNGTAAGKQLCLRCGGNGELYRWTSPRGQDIRLTISDADQIAELRTKIAALEDRIKALEERES